MLCIDLWKEWEAFLSLSTNNVNIILDFDFLTQVKTYFLTTNDEHETKYINDLHPLVESIIWHK